MQPEERFQLQQVLRCRHSVIADSWYKAIDTIGFVPCPPAEAREHILALTEEIITLLLTEPFEPGRAWAVGTSLADIYPAEPEVLSKTQEVLTCQLVEGLPDHQIVALQPRLAALLGGLAAGFLQQTREIILADQERIYRAAIAELRRAARAL